MRTVYLCSGKGCCPVVELDDSEVRIGENGNMCKLKISEWDALKEKIRSREL